MLIDRVIVLAETADKQNVVVLSVDGLNKDPSAMRSLSGAQRGAVALWSIVSTVVFIAGIVGSFIWHWWAFLPATALAVVLHWANAKSLTDFNLEFLPRDAITIERLTQRGLVWTAPSRSVVPEG
jgi:hypothetical protein